jgi:hypothetical protein
MAAIAIIPGANFMYSLHGGPAWLALPFVYPYALVRLFMMHRSAQPEQKSRIKRFAIASLLAYIPISLAAAFFGAYSVDSFLGKGSMNLPLGALYFWAFFILPVGFLVFWGLNAL